MRSRSGIESAFISRSWRSLVQPRMGRQFIAWRRQPQGIPNEPTIILSPRGGGRGNSRQGRRWCRVARADRDSQVSALGVGLPSGAPFRCAAPDSAPETWTWSTRSEGGAPTCWAATSTETRSRGSTEHALDMLPPVPGGQGGPRFPGFGVGRGFAIWGPFPVHAPDTHRKRGPLSTRTLRCTLPFQLSMALVALFSTALNTARTGSISAFQLSQQFGSFGLGSGFSHDFAPLHRLTLAFGHACRTIR